MESNPKRQRHSTRLKDYDYTQAGAYFITLCTYERQYLFGEIVEGVLRVSEVGNIVEEHWLALPSRFTNVDLDAFVMMPNHVHGILRLSSATVGAQRAAPLPVQATESLHAKSAHAINVAPGSLGAIVRSFKSAVTKQAHLLNSDVDLPIWQRNYYDHIVRSEKELNKIRRYIENNPLQWELDRDNLGNHQPAALSTKSYLDEITRQI